jgi:ketopantoate hydroxymethyltransferase
MELQDHAATAATITVALIGRDVLSAYDRDVKDGHFPSESESYEHHPANLHIAKHAA